jgi:hypothetical protein
MGLRHHPLSGTVLGGIRVRVDRGLGFLLAEIDMFVGLLQIAVRATFAVLLFVDPELVRHGDVLVFLVIG